MDGPSSNWRRMRTFSKFFQNLHNVAVLYQLKIISEPHVQAKKHLKTFISKNVWTLR